MIVRGASRHLLTDKNHQEVEHKHLEGTLAHTEEHTALAPELQ